MYNTNQHLQRRNFLSFSLLFCLLACLSPHMCHSVCLESILAPSIFQQTVCQLNTEPCMWAGPYFDLLDAEGMMMMAYRSGSRLVLSPLRDATRRRYETGTVCIGIEDAVTRSTPVRMCVYKNTAADRQQIHRWMWKLAERVHLADNIISWRVALDS